METMSSYERIKRTFEHKETDRVPILDSPWNGTIQRWQNEGMPRGTDWRDFFGADKAEQINVDITPRYEIKVLEETDRYKIETTPWGVVLKNFKELDSTPEFIDFTVTTPEAWEEAKARMQPSKDRINWDVLKKNFEKWRSDERWIEAGFWFGFDVTHSWMVGTETLLMAMIEEPDWVTDMIDTYLNMCISLFDMVWDAGYHFDGITWPDDMGYKGTAFFSVETYRNMFKPFHTKAVQWAHNKGIYTRLHSCGDIMKLLPDVVETGIDALNPIEIKAGMDIQKIKDDYGKKIVLHGGTNAVLWNQQEEILLELDRVLPILMKDGGYIFASDHSIPNSVDTETMHAIIKKVKDYSGIAFR